MAVGRERRFSKVFIGLCLLNICVCVQSCPTLCNPVDGSPPGSSVHEIFQVRILEWVAISFSRDLPDPGIKPRSPALTPLLTELEVNLVEQG